MSSHKPMRRFESLQGTPSKMGSHEGDNNTRKLPQSGENPNHPKFHHRYVNMWFPTESDPKGSNHRINNTIFFSRIGAAIAGEEFCPIWRETQRNGKRAIATPFIEEFHSLGENRRDVFHEDVYAYHKLADSPLSELAKRGLFKVFALSKVLGNLDLHSKNITIQGEAETGPFMLTDIDLSGQFEYFITKENAKEFIESPLFFDFKNESYIRHNYPFYSPKPFYSEKEYDSTYALSRFTKKDVDDFIQLLGGKEQIPNLGIAKTNKIKQKVLRNGNPHQNSMVFTGAEKEALRTFLEQNGRHDLSEKISPTLREMVQKFDDLTLQAKRDDDALKQHFKILFSAVLLPSSWMRDQSNKMFGNPNEEYIQTISEYFDKIWHGLSSSERFKQFFKEDPKSFLEETLKHFHRMALRKHPINFDGVFNKYQKAREILGLSPEGRDAFDVVAKVAQQKAHEEYLQFKIKRHWPDITDHEKILSPGFKDWSAVSEFLERSIDGEDLKSIALRAALKEKVDDYLHLYSPATAPSGELESKAFPTPSPGLSSVSTPPMSETPISSEKPQEDKQLKEKIKSQFSEKDFEDFNKLIEALRGQQNKLKTRGWSTTEEGHIIQAKQKAIEAFLNAYDARLYQSKEFPEFKLESLDARVGMKMGRLSGFRNLFGKAKTYELLQKIYSHPITKFINEKKPTPSGKTEKFNGKAARGNGGAAAGAGVGTDPVSPVKVPQAGAFAFHHQEEKAKKRDPGNGFSLN